MHTIGEASDGMRKISQQKRRELDCILLSGVPNMTARTFHQLVQQFGDVEQILRAPSQDARWKNVPPTIQKGIVALHKQDAEQQLLSAMRAAGIRAMTIFNDQYPPPLRNIPDPPPVLYYKGTPPQDWGQAVAIVGARKCSQYAKDVATAFGREFSAAGITVVSGLAYGADTAAHLGALQGSGATVGVLGCGADVVYPRSNARLYRDVIDRGCILSEYPPGTRPLPGHFPMRNRIISGLCSATILVEASERSGALITVTCALEQGREVFVVPGNIFDPRCAGSNALIQAGATPAFSASGVAEYLGWGELAPLASQPAAHEQPALSALSAPENAILSQLREGAQDTETLCAQLQMPAETLLAHLTVLELRGIIRQLPGGRFDISPH